MTTPSQPDERDPEREAGALGSAVSSPDDEASGGAAPGPASGAAGPTWPPADTEPAAQGD